MAGLLLPNVVFNLEAVGVCLYLQNNICFSFVSFYNPSETVILRSDLDYVSCSFDSVVLVGV
jgi:hypothetical protein